MKYFSTHFHCVGALLWEVLEIHFYAPLQKMLVESVSASSSSIGRTRTHGNSPPAFSATPFCTQFREVEPCVFRQERAYHVCQKIKRFVSYG